MNQKGFIKDIVIIVLVILLLGGGYFYFSKKPAYVPAENTNTNQKVVNETAGWKIYRNDKYGFEFRYPEIFIKSKQGEWGLNFSDKDDYYGMRVRIVEEKLDPAMIKSLVGFLKRENIEEVKVDGKKSYRFIEGDAGCGGYDYRIPLTEKEHLSLYFSGCVYDGGSIPHVPNEDEIVSTFKFTK